MIASARAGPYFRLFVESIWDVHSNEEESFDSTLWTLTAYLEHSQQQGEIIRLDSSNFLSLCGTFTATKSNRSTRLLRLLETI